MEMRSEAMDGGVRLRLDGEFDIGSIAMVEASLRRAEEDQPGLLVLDLSGVTFIDSSGLRVILTADRRAKQQGRRFALIEGSAAIQRIFKITGVDSVLEFMDGAPPDGASPR
jgi:anti-sigma B factor antagonist